MRRFFVVVVVCVSACVLFASYIYLACYKKAQEMGNEGHILGTQKDFCVSTITTGDQLRKCSSNCLYMCRQQ